MVRFKALIMSGTVAWLCLLALPARASPYDLNLDSITPAGGGQFTWTYSVIIGGGERVQQGANTPTPNLPSNRPDFFILYDFLGYVPGSIVAPAGFTATVENFTALANRPDLQQGVTDNPAIPNLIWTKNATTGNIVGPTTFGGFSANSIFNAVNPFGLSSSEFTNVGGAADNTNNVSTINAPVPTPEPATVVLMLAGPVFVLGAVRRGLRRRQD